MVQGQHSVEEGEMAGAGECSEVGPAEREAAGQELGVLGKPP